MKKLTVIPLMFILTSPLAAQLTVSITSSNGFSITCITPSVFLTATSTPSSGATYSWLPGANPYVSSGANATVSMAGSYSVQVTQGSNTVTQAVSIGINTTSPVSSISSTFVASSSQQTISMAALSPTVNIVHYVYSPQGGTHTANQTTITYVPGGEGTYTHCIVNMVNGCSSCKTFTVSQGAGLADNSGDADFLVYPNPARGHVTIRCLPGTVFSVYNIIGTRVLHRSVSNALTIEILPPGVYFVCSEGLRSRVVKVMVE